MIKRRRIQFTIFHFAAVFSSSVTMMADEPLPFFAKEGRVNQFEWKKAAADSALRNGLSSVAASLYEQLLVTEVDQGEKEEILLGLVTAQISEGRFAEAENTTRTRLDKLLGLNGHRSPTSFHKELGLLMWEHCGMARTAEGLQQCLNI